MTKRSAETLIKFSQVRKNGQKINQTSKRDIDPDVTRTRSLLIWSQTRYHCATESTQSIILETILCSFLFPVFLALGHPNIFAPSK